MKTILSYLKSAPSNWSSCKISDQKCLIWVFFIKNAFFLCFWARILKKYCHIWNQHPQICLVARFCKRAKMCTFGTKNALIGYFWTRIFKNYCHIWNQHPQICLIVKFCKKTKISKFGTKNALFGYFLARILKKYCHIWNHHPQICQKWVWLFKIPCYMLDSGCRWLAVENAKKILSYVKYFSILVGWRKCIILRHLCK